MIELTYSEKINMLIQKAENEADKIMISNPNKSEQRVGADGEFYSFDWWSYHFHKAMNRLTKEKGLRTI